MSSATIKHQKRHRTTQFALSMNYFLLGMEIHAYMTNGFTLLSLVVAGQAGVETVQVCLK